MKKRFAIRKGTIFTLWDRKQGWAIDKSEDADYIEKEKKKWEQKEGEEFEENDKPTI